MLNDISSEFKVLATNVAAEPGELSALARHFGRVPSDYLELLQEATEVELQHPKGAYLRIWGPLGCIDMDKGYEISQRISGAFPCGDNGGGKALLYMNGRSGAGLYIVGFGDLDREDASWVAPTLRDLLEKCRGLDALG